MSYQGHAIDDNVYNLNAILHPGSVYDHPRDVLADKELTLAEKRSTLASWASDAAAVTSCPSLRAIPGHRQPVSIDDILEALSALDHGPRPPGGKPARRHSSSRISEAA
jgi:acetyl esterase/lipase